MSWLDRLRRRPVQRSPLHAVLSKLSFEQAEATYKNVSNPDLRLPAAISTWALHLAHRYHGGLVETSSPLDKTAAERVRSAYDPVACEATAFVHFALLDQYLIQEDTDAQDEAYFSVLRDAAHVSSSILTQYAGTKSEFVMNRVMKYSHEQSFKSTAPLEVLNGLVIAAVTNAGLSTPLVIQLATATYSPIFVSAYIEQFRKSARVMYLAHQEGAL